MRNDGHDPPVLGQIRGLDPQQRRTAKIVAFWFLFAYLELYVLQAASQSFLISIAAVGLIVFAFRSTIVGRRPNFIIINGGIAVALFWGGAALDHAALIADGAVVAALALFELLGPNRLLLVILAAYHLAALFFSPWNLLGEMKTSPAIASHVVARLFAALLTVAIALHRHRDVQDPERIVPHVEPIKPHRPLSVAEWEARNPKN